MDTLTGECVYLFVEDMPIYCNGERDVTEDIFSILKITSDSTNLFVRKVNLQFVINKNGELIGARIKDKRSINNIEKCILDAAYELEGTWSVGVLNGNKVSVLLTYVINIDFFD